MLLFSLSVLFVALLYTVLFRRATGSPSPGHKLPPGPTPLPIIGNLHSLGKLPHRTFHSMAKKYGPIMMLRLGSVPTVVVSSSRASELIVKTHDIEFASRPRSLLSESLSYGSKGVIFCEYGPYWRNVRKFLTLEVVSVAKTASFAWVRREELEVLVGQLRKAAEAREAVNLSEKVVELIENTTYRILFGKGKDDWFDLKTLVREAMELAGSFSLSDYVPFLAPLDPQGLKGQLKKLRKASEKLLDKIIDEHIEDANRDKKKLDNDIVGLMLNLMKNSSLVHDELAQSIDKSNIKAIVSEIAAASIDTSSTAIEWVLSELIRNPRVMRLVKEEIKSVMGLKEMVDEKELEKLNYLDMVVKESLRLHPAGPFLLPRESRDDIVVDGYFIPKKSMILVSLWACGRDTDVWSDNAEEFLPERFIGIDIDLKGRHFELLPFGSGRRGCPGMHLGLTNMKLIVSQLVHSFDWALPNGMSPNELDMTESFGLTTPRAVPLVVVPSLNMS